MDIKETKEMIEGLGEIANVAKAVLADGRIGFDDAKHLLKADLAKIAAAVDNMSLIKEEIADCTLEEAKALLTLLADKVAAVKAA